MNNSILTVQFLFNKKDSYQGLYYNQYDFIKEVVLVAMNFHLSKLQAVAITFPVIPNYSIPLRNRSSTTVWSIEVGLKTGIKPPASFPACGT